MTFLKSLQFVTVLVVLIIVFILTRESCKKIIECVKKPSVDTIIIRDTIWLSRDSIIYKKMIITETIFYTDTLPPVYIPDTNYSRLKAQYETLTALFMSKNIYRDTVMIDSIGYITITDTVQQNILNNRSFTYTYKIPSTSELITILKPELNHHQFYVGGGINTYRFFVPFSLEAGLILKTKRDHIYGLKIGSDLNKQVFYGFQTYWRIGNKNK